METRRRHSMSKLLLLVSHTSNIFHTNSDEITESSSKEFSSKTLGKVTLKKQNKKFALFVDGKDITAN